MPQVTLYIDEATQARLREAAAQRKVSQSQFVAELIRNATANQWPAEVLALAGIAQSAPQPPGSVFKVITLAGALENKVVKRSDTYEVTDRATIEEEHALELRTRDRERKLLKKIEQSIQRIDSGDYGYCDETGEPIGVGRLLARPTATLSLEAQQRRELKQKMFGD